MNSRIAVPALPISSAARGAAAGPRSPTPCTRTCVSLRPLDAHPERAQRRERRQAILAGEEAADHGAALGDAAEHQRAMRDRFVPRNAQLTLDACAPAATGSAVRRLQRSLQARAGSCGASSRSLCCGSADRDAQALAPAHSPPAGARSARAQQALVDLRAPARPRRTSRKLRGRGRGPQPQALALRLDARQLAHGRDARC